MTLNWYKTINLDDFAALSLVSRTETYALDIGDTEITFYNDNAELISVLVDDVYLSMDLNSKNPFVFEGYGLFRDEDNNLWVGFTP